MASILPFSKKMKTPKFTLQSRSKKNRPKIYRWHTIYRGIFCFIFKLDYFSICIRLFGRIMSFVRLGEETKTYRSSHIITYKSVSICFYKNGYVRICWGTGTSNSEINRTLTFFGVVYFNFILYWSIWKWNIDQT